MENILNLSPAQLMLGLVLQIWIFVLFPVLVLRKLNYMTRLLEGLYTDGEQETANADEGKGQAG